nr:helicase/secretion neighborhood TadE-like protein [Streptococcus thermophilus]
MRTLLDDRGHATILSASIVAAVVSLAMVVAGLVSHTAGTHRAQMAADLAAVAGATALYAGHTGAQVCATAEKTASLNGAELRDCALDGADVLVTAAVSTAGGARDAEATARAGPL